MALGAVAVAAANGAGGRHVQAQDSTPLEGVGTLAPGVRTNAMAMRRGRNPASSSMRDEKSTETGGARRFEFGTSYLRVFVRYVYLQPTRFKKRSFFVTVATQNKKPLEFKYAVEPENNKFFSARGDAVVIPYVALNTKAPLIVTQEVRTARDVARPLALVQNVLTSVASAFTGPAAANLSLLTQRANVSQGIVSNFENQTAITDSNRHLILDHRDHNTMDLKTLFSTFTRGRDEFEVRDGNKTFRIKEAFVEDAVEVENSDRDVRNNQIPPTSYKLLLKKPRSASASKARKSGEAETTNAQPEEVHPTGREAYSILHFEVYNPYPGLKDNPGQVPGVAAHFDAMDAVLNANRISTTPASLTDTRQKLIEAEGIKLIATLQSLTDTGDLSLADAATILSTYCERAKAFEGATGFKDGALKALGRRFRFALAVR